MHCDISYSCISSIGKIRGINQDNFICNGTYMNDGAVIDFPLCGKVSSRSNTLFGVFDGMGGEEYGEIASLIAAKNAATLKIEKNPLSELMRFCVKTNEDICDYTVKNDLSSMGTTAAMAAFTESGIFICNIGDSRIYRFSGGILTQISKDHTSIAPFGVKPPLSQNLGIPAEEMIIQPYPAQGAYSDGDIYLICSDGLTDMVTDEEIGRILSENPIETANIKLLEAAMSGGGRDNITAILCRIRLASGLFFRRRQN